MKELIAKRYAKALMESSSAKELKAQLTALNALRKALQKEEYAEVVASPLVPAGKKFELLIQPLEGKIDAKLYNLLRLMSEKGRLDLIPDLAEILAFELKRKSNRFDGVVEADDALAKEELARLETVLEKYSGAKIQLKQTGKSGDGLHVAVEDLGLELSVSKSRIKSDLLDFIQRAL